MSDLNGLESAGYFRSLRHKSDQDRKGEWRWRLKSSNGRILTDSGEGNKNGQDCKDDIDRRK